MLVPMEPVERVPAPELDSARGTDSARTAKAGAYGTGRLSGPDRYSTAVEVSRHWLTDAWLTTHDIDTVTIASGLNYPDALAGGPFASMFGPLLLVPPTGPVPADVIAEVQRLQPENLVVLGGTGAVSGAVVNQLAPYAANGAVRLSGADRYETAATVTLELREQMAQSPNPRVMSTVFVATGQGFADALGAGAAAPARNGGILLTEPGALPAATEAALATIRPTTVVIVGGTGAVSSGVQARIAQVVPTANIQRVAGGDRFETAALISRNWIAPGRFVYLASGLDYPDALAVVPLAGVAPASPILLSRQPCAPRVTNLEIERLFSISSAPVFSIWAVGGTGVLSNQALAGAECP